MFDFDGFARLSERMLGRARARSQVWVAVWLAAILVVTAIAGISNAPSGAYVILVVTLLRSQANTDVERAQVLRDERRLRRPMRRVERRGRQMFQEANTVCTFDAVLR